MRLVIGKWNGREYFQCLPSYAVLDIVESLNLCPHCFLDDAGHDTHNDLLDGLIIRPKQGQELN